MENLGEDHAYHVERERRERKLADECTDREAKARHLKLAAEHAARARGCASGHAALQADETDPSNIDQTRTAGAESIRDHNPARPWDAVDEASDESFPASDPPSTP